MDLSVLPAIIDIRAMPNVDTLACTEKRVNNRLSESWNLCRRNEGGAITEESARRAMMIAINKEIIMQTSNRVRFVL